MTTPWDLTEPSMRGEFIEEAELDTKMRSTIQDPNSETSGVLSPQAEVPSQGLVNRVEASGPAVTLPPSFADHYVVLTEDCVITIGEPAQSAHRLRVTVEGPHSVLFQNEALAPVSWANGLQPAHVNPTIYDLYSTNGGQTYSAWVSWTGVATPPVAPESSDGFVGHDGAPTTNFTADISQAAEGDYVLFQIAAETSNPISVTLPGTSVETLPGNQTDVAFKYQTPSHTTSDQMDDVAIWVHPTSPSDSKVFGCRKSDTGGGIYVYNLDGTVHQFLATGKKTNNIDIRQHAGTGRWILAASNRTDHTLSYYEWNPTTLVLSAVGSTSLGWEPYGCCMADVGGTLYAYVTQDQDLNPAMRRYTLTVPGSGNVTGSQSGSRNPAKLTEGMAHYGGTLFFAVEDDGLYKVAEDLSGSATLIDATGGGNLFADVEGVEVVPGRSGDPGYILASSQGDSSFHVYDLAAPHTHRKRFTVNSVNDTDGVTATRKDLGAQFPDGLVVVHDSTTSNPGANFKFVDAGLIFGRYVASGLTTIVPPTKSGATPLNFSLYGYRVPPSPPSSLTFVLSEACEGSLSWSINPGVDAVSPMAAGGPGLSLFPAASSTITAPSVTTDVAGAKIVAGAAIPSGTGTITPPAGWTTKVTATDRVAVIATKGQQATAGSTGDVAFTLNSSMQAVAWQVALRPAGTPGDGGGTGSNPSQATMHEAFSQDWSATWPMSPSGVWTIPGPKIGRSSTTMDPSRATVTGGSLTLTHNANERAGAEIMSNFSALQPGPGKYEARIKGSAVSGVANTFYWVSNNFGPRRIEVHLLSKSTGQAVFKITWNGVTHEHTHTLGFDHSAAYHDYAFQWESGSKVIFYVDGTAVHTFNATASIGLTSPDRGVILANIWTDQDPNWANGLPTAQTTMQVDHITYWASQTSPVPSGTKPTGFPATTGLTYGVPAGTTLTSMNARTIGAETIEDRQITGVFEVDPGAGNVATLRRVRVLGDGTTNEGYAIRVRSGRLIMEDCEIVGIGGAQAADNCVSGTVTMRRCYLTDFGRDGIKIGNDSTYEDTYIKANLAVKKSGAHMDGMQMTSARSNVVIRRCVIDMGYPTTSAILIKRDLSTTPAPGPITIEDNYLGGGGITLYTIVGDQGAESRNVTVRDNIFHGDANWYEIQRSPGMTGLLYTGNTVNGGAALRIQDI